jgi:hypothetical protein
MRRDANNLPINDHEIKSKPTRDAKVGRDADKVILGMEM